MKRMLVAATILVASFLKTVIEWTFDWILDEALSNDARVVVNRLIAGSRVLGRADMPARNNSPAEVRKIGRESLVCLGDFST